MTTEHPTGLSLKQRIVGGYALLVILFAVVTTMVIVGFIQTRRRTLSLEKIGHQQVLHQKISQAAVAIANQTERFTSEGHVSAAHQAKVLSGRLRSRLESYISDHSLARFSHGLCPDCLEEYLPKPKPDP